MVLHELLSPHPRLKKLSLYGYSTPQQLTSYLLVLTKTYLAKNSTHQTAPDYQRIFRRRLQYRLYTEMHHSLWASYMDTFRGLLVVQEHPREDP
jgi:hypothetical protein